MLLVVEDNGVEGEKDRAFVGYLSVPGKWAPTTPNVKTTRCEPDLVGDRFRAQR